MFIGPEEMAKEVIQKDLEGVKEFCNLLKRGPAFLFLGQDYLQLESGKDPFLSEILRKYGKIATNHSQYSLIFEGEAQNSGESALAWMQERCSRLSIPQWLKTVASFNWNGVYSSAIDVIWPGAFRSEWRELQHILEEKYEPINPRNRLKLHCTYLFGNVSRTEEEERPPLTEFELTTRKPTAIALAHRLPEILTPLGVLVIEGYAGEQDWFSPENFFSIVDKLNPGQVHVFNVTEELTKNKYIAHLIKRGKLKLYSESLATYLLRGEEAGFLQLGKRPEEEEHGRHIQLREKILTVPSNVWNQVSLSAMILDDSLLIAPPSLSEEKRYYEFRNFLAESSTKPVWPGYERGFAFRREFEKKLDGVTHQRLKSHELQKEPVILHGQTGTGKTVALGALAYKIRKKKKHPVLFIERRPKLPINSDIDYFCKWAEDCGAPSTLIVWDGMLDPEQYYDLLRYLTGRGRKVVVVGSCYKRDPKSDQENFIEAPASLSQSEQSNFEKFINNCDPLIGQLLKEPLKRKRLDDAFLVALYRLLPPTRSLIRSGVHREVGSAEKEIRLKLQERLSEPINTLGYAFMDAGLITKETFTAIETKEIGGEKVSETEELIGLIIVPGRFGLKVPVELLLRACGKEGYSNFVTSLNEFDFFRLSEDATGNIMVAPRHPLEAKLLAQVRLGGAKAEVAFVEQLISEIKRSYDSLDTTEIQFGVDLIHSIGPNGQEAGYFAPYYREISGALKELREKRGVQNPRLMLQEATLLREYVLHESKYDRPPEDTIDILDETETILTSALKILENNRRNTQMRSPIFVELASTLGTKAHHVSRNTDQPKESIPLFQKAREYSFKARDFNPNSYYPIDVLFWITRDSLRTELLDPHAEAEAKADILYAFEMAEAEDFSVDQREHYHARHYEVGKLLGRQDISDEAFESLRAQGSCAGYFLKAYDNISDIPKNTELTPLNRELCRSAVEYLEENRSVIANDSRCLHLLLHTWWKMQTGKPIFYGERQTVTFSEENWKYFLGIIIDLMKIGEFSTNPALMYLQGLATFHLGHIGDAFNIFRELERESDYVTGRRRIIRSYLASTIDGKPRKFNGTVTWKSEDGRKGEIYVEELRRKIPFFPRDFNRPDIKKHDSLNDFQLAFNFIGPIADPRSYFKSQ